MRIIEPIKKSDGFYDILTGVRSVSIENIKEFINRIHRMFEPEFQILENQVFLLEGLMYKGAKVGEARHKHFKLIMWKLVPL